MKRRVESPNVLDIEQERILERERVERSFKQQDLKRVSLNSMYYRILNDETKTSTSRKESGDLENNHLVH